MSTADKLNKLIETKEAIRQSIIAKGTNVGEDVPFSKYPDKIEEIQTVPVEYMNPEFYEIRTNGGTNFKGLFSHATGDNLDLSSWDVSKVTDMDYLFNYCSAKNIDVSGWDTRNVTNTTRMFDNFSGEIDISNLDFNKVNSCDNMFYYASLDKINGIEDRNPVPNSSRLYYFFSGAIKNGTLNLSNWDVSKITNMYRLFYSAQCRKLILENWKTTNVTDMSAIFSINNLTDLVIPDWDMTNTTSSSNLFGYITNTTLYHVNLARSNDTTIKKIINYLPARTEVLYGEMDIPTDSSEEVVNQLIAKYWKPIGPKLDLVSCEIAAELDEVLLGKKTKIYIGKCNPWYGDTKNNFELVVTNNSVASIDEDGILTARSVGSTEIYAVLKDTRAVISNTITITVAETDSNPNIFKFRTKDNTNPSYYKINDITLSSSNCTFDNITKIWTYDAGNSIVSLNNPSTSNINITEIIKLDTSNVTDMSYMFHRCQSLTSIPELDTTNVTNMQSMFYYCNNLALLDVSNFNTSKVTNMQSMFKGCNNLTSLDVSNFDTSNVTDMSSMFEGCNNLTSLDLSNFNTSNVTNMRYMFYNCNSLKYIKGELDLCGVGMNNYGFVNGCYNLEELYLINIFDDYVINNPDFTLNLSQTKIKDECLISIISELPNLYDKGLTDTSKLIFTLPPTNTLTADQVQPAIDKGWTVANVNSNVINAASTYSLRNRITDSKVYKLVENENGSYQSQDGTFYDILEVNNAVSPEGINVGWVPFDNLEQAMSEFQVSYVPKTLEE